MSPPASRIPGKIMIALPVLFVILMSWLVIVQASPSCDFGVSFKRTEGSNPLEFAFEPAADNTLGFGVSTATFEVAAKATEVGFDAYIINSYRDHVIPVDSTIDYSTVNAVSSIMKDSAHKMSTLNWMELVNDIKSAIVQIKATTKRPVAIWGMSEGAALAFLASQNSGDLLAATAIFYGSPGSYTGSAPLHFDPTKIDIPVHLFCAELDSFSNFSSCDTLSHIKSLMTTSPEAKLTQYNGVGH
eukprot:UC4_evm1s466